MARRSVSPSYGKTGQYTRRGGGGVEGQERSKRTSSWPIICIFLPKPSGIVSIRVMHGPKVRACSSLNTRDRSGRIFSNILFACNILQRDDHKSLIREAVLGGCVDLHKIVRGVLIAVGYQHDILRPLWNHMLVQWALGSFWCVKESAWCSWSVSSVPALKKQ